LQFKKAESEEEEEDDIPYGFGFFHFVFAMGAMYFAMIFVGWNEHQTMEKSVIHQSPRTSIIITNVDLIDPRCV
jgi:serine incorporator 1/3